MNIKRSLFDSGLCQWCILRPAEYQLDMAGTQLELFNNPIIVENVCLKCFNDMLLVEQFGQGSLIDITI